MMPSYKKRIAVEAQELALKIDPQVLGTPTHPVILTPENIEVQHVALLSALSYVTLPRNPIRKAC